MPPSELTSEGPESTSPSKDQVASSAGYRYPSSAAEVSLVQHEECQYLNLIRYILADGESRPDRTGTGTLSIFAPPQLRFSLRDNVFPLLTTKRVFFRAVLEELLWFVKADTNALHLSELGVKIWDGNGSREYLDSIGLQHRKVGDLGPVYGFQWRHYGAEYVDCDTDYTGQGIDQLADVINKIKNSPYDRRIIMSAWNPSGRVW
jgi:thymidylate synthase